MARRAVHRWLPVAFLLTMLGGAQLAEASSCAPRFERYFLTCIDGVCQGAFRVAQVGAFGTCGRRAKVLDIDVEDSRFLVPLVSEAFPQANGLFELAFEHGYWRDGGIDSGQLSRFLDDVLGERRSALAGGVATAAPSVVVAQFNKSFGSRWLSQKSPDPSPEEVANERRQWEMKANQGLWSSVLGYTVYGLGFLLILAVLVGSIDLFYRRLHCTPVDQRSRRLLAPIAIQVILGVANSAASFVTFGFWLGILFLPAVVVVLLAEAWAAIRHRRPITAQS